MRPSTKLPAATHSHGELPTLSSITSTSAMISQAFSVKFAWARIRRITRSLPPSPTDTFSAPRTCPTRIDSHRFTTASAAASTSETVGVVISIGIPFPLAPKHPASRAIGLQRERNRL
jgi:hypothetical protein